MYSKAFLVFLFFQFYLSIAVSAPIPAPPGVSAGAHILLDSDSGLVLSGHNLDERQEPASTTKIMTAYIVFDRLRKGEVSLYDEVRISKKAWRNPGVVDWQKGSRMFVEVGSKVSVDDLLHGLIIQSGNDAAIALAEHIAGTENDFVKIMNEYAAQLGMQNTHYQNSTGWPAADHYSSAGDLAKLSRALIKNFPDSYKIFSEKQFSYNNISQKNRNTLLWKDASVDGIKTGLTKIAGHCLVASAERKGMRLISVILGAGSKDSLIKYSQSLLNYGFRYYETHKLFAADTVLKERRIWKGNENFLNLGLAEDVFVTVAKGQYQQLKPIMNVKKSMYAPIDKGEVIGKLEINLGNKVIAEQELIALNEIGRGNIFKQIADQLVYIFQ